MNVLGIETSCDETAAAVIKDGTTILSSVVASQIDVHHAYGGVVPELASRKHMEVIVPVVQQALQAAGVPLGRINGVAVTQGPGLVGSLLVGFSFAKSLAFAADIPYVGVDHLEGHIHSAFFAPTPPSFPFVALLVSGGHTALYRVKDFLDWDLMGKTRDDAAGEAFDKVAKMLGLGYPGGPVIDQIARKGHPDRIRFPRAFLDPASLDFSFSGVKTAVNRYLQTHPEHPNLVPDIAAGFQEAVVDVLAVKAVRAAEAAGCRHLALVGGVAANARLQGRMQAAAGEKGIVLHVPPQDLCGDNAVMIAHAGYHRLDRGEACGLKDDVYSRAGRPPAGN
ncbi:MAG: tRNA (adenosine(37)-N6)-threonylcarbamoyltransferase complex transferase subunit TsaD [Deltaproteobacteria bacterium]|nr:tRNA (adenosine(37)-N6)-threonylcarbamoyltransferase complex transferase subunit TsaD [Deltaproteobacteria bacterium]MBW1954868.1 tRNA (adenosine(37)-N6)-threonylcarbamoyltransferase complex transferase subunit TsaD [Deltaproteobacteria bacterium]MBW2041251.1 tRNA (adenosine(37)-N6)-threonylcarbamoyltransferase complex transferase subunit TsaD [Deltaproteobacteria bacterium]MBW2132949.1 tRNA (adenosine(37)-N6)-threonylcarbamoyltransferase complex transferase subunit TsaD [Deltaproteobacteria 